MILAYDIDTKRLAKRLHMPEEEITALLDSSDDFVVTQRRKNPDCFPRIHKESLSNIIKKESFLTDWREESEQSFTFIKNQFTNMSQLLDSIKSADDNLHNEVVSVGNRVSGSLSDLNAKISSMQDQLAAGQQPSAEDLNEAAAIVAQAQEDAKALSNVDPAAPAEQPAN